MATLVDTLSRDHEHCHDLFATSDNAVADSDWQTAPRLFEAFRDAALLYFEREERILFPAFEQRTGMQAGPTYVMCSEHDQMRDCLGALGQALESRKTQAYLGLSDTLLMLMRQHNMKEEQMLYPMADQALADSVETIVHAMRVMAMTPAASHD
jgi:hemerythrin-like domain-containing protein